MLITFVCRADDDDATEWLPTGKHITPLAAPGAKLTSFNPGLKDAPSYLAGQAISAAVSPDGKTMAVLTSGFNRYVGADEKAVPADSREYVFLYDVTGHAPVQKQVLTVANTFAGIAFARDGHRFYVSGGVDDSVHEFLQRSGGEWAEDGVGIPLGHASALGLLPNKTSLAAAGVGVSEDGQVVVVANVYNDSVSVVNVADKKVVSEIDLRPGKADRTKVGVPGGEYPFWVLVKGNRTAYVSSLRDREVVVVDLEAQRVTARIPVKGNPNKMVFGLDGKRLYVVCDNSDLLVEIDPASNRVLASVVTGVAGPLFAKWTGDGPNSVALSRDGGTLYVTNGGTNCISVLRKETGVWRVVGAIPTGWYPSAVALSADQRTLFVVNGKTNAGPNPDLDAGKGRKGGTQPGPNLDVPRRNEYVLQLEKSSLLTIPVPSDASLSHLTHVVAQNNGFFEKSNQLDVKTMGALHSRIHHVIYIIKENRTYDQVLGDLGKGNGDSALTEFGQAITPNFHKIAKEFVDLDAFYNSGEVSGNGWPWSTSGRESDYGQKAVPLNYAGRGTSYDYEGLNRDINVGLATAAERRKANPKTPDDPDLLPGAINVSEPDGPAGSGRGRGYIWDAVLRAGLTFREYGCMSDTNLDSPRDPQPFAHRVVMSHPSNPELYKFGDPYYRGFDPGYPDFYRESEWEREFDGYVAHHNLPDFEIVQLPVDHMGDFDTAISGVNTPEAQQADNDYAVGKLLTRLAHSTYAKDTLVFIVEDDAQDGPDHVDAHRSTAYVVGPFVKQGAVISEHYTTVSVVRTIEDVLGLEHLNLNTATARPMTEVFDLEQRVWTFDATPSAALLQTKLPLSPQARARAEAVPPAPPAHDARYWAEQTKSFDFSSEDRVDALLFNQVIWHGLKNAPYPDLYGFVHE